MSTARDLITLSLKDIGAIAAGEAPSAAEASDGLAIINNMLDRWSAKSLMIFDRVVEKFQLVIGTQSYTIGTGGTFNTTRPQIIDDATIEVQGTVQLNEFSLTVINIDDWSRISIKSTQTAIPQVLYMENSFPLATINLWPVPGAANKIVLYSWKPLTSIATLDTAITLPPGFFEAIQYNLDLRLAPQYGKQLDPQIIQMAMDSMADIKQMNSKPIYLATDLGTQSRGRPFNWLTGE